ncbi:MAG: septal ring lytic transglycosylase RlpA family protein [Parvibaculum sp.]
MSSQTTADFPSTTSPWAQLRRLCRLALVTAFAASPIALLGCAEAQLGTHVAKTLGNSGGTGGGVYKVGSPYQIAGRWYTPKEDERYDREGIASWYGPNFHGKPTANGEVFDQNLVTAAHPTLPMPIYARVTNLENGRSLIVRINDRGPFVADREIDLSRRSAELLGYLNKGTARVRVQYLRRAPLEGDVSDVQSVVADNGDFIMPQAEDARDQERAAPVPTSAVRVASLTPVALGGAATNSTLTEADMAPIPDTPSVSSSPASQVAAIAPGTYVQAGAFSNSANAQALKVQLSDLGPVEVHPVNVNGTEMYRVRVGPVQDPQTANNLLQQVTGRGHSNARVITE